MTSPVSSPRPATALTAESVQAAYDAALSGQGSLAMVVGEPGIGKTTLCEQLATYATMRGGATLVGH